MQLMMTGIELEINIFAKSVLSSTVFKYFWKIIKIIKKGSQFNNPITIPILLLKSVNLERSRFINDLTVLTIIKPEQIRSKRLYLFILKILSLYMEVNIDKIKKKILIGIAEGRKKVPI